MDTTKVIYNGMSIRQILLNLPKNMTKQHKTQYIEDCIYVYNNELTKNNLGFCHLVRNSNFNLIKLYNNL